jgi:CBS domain containing-hemolysin-like protein
VEPSLALLAILIQAVFSGSETALARANWIRVTSWSRERRLWAGAARRLLEVRESALIMTLVGTNLFIVVSSSLAESFFVRTFGTRATALAVAATTVGVLVFGQFLPKALAQAFPEYWLSLTAPFLRAARRAFRPLIWLLARISGVRLGEASRPDLTRSDFLFALRGRSQGGRVGIRTGGIATRLLEFPEVLVREAMTPLDRVVMVPEEIPLDALLALIREHRYSRYPVYRGARDNPVGLIHVRDLLELPRRIVRKALFVAAEARAIEIMDRMRNQGEHLAFVLDGSGRTCGIVTLEDLLEELVGEIRSEE